MLPLNIGLPKTPHGLPIDRCHEPCPSVIPNTDQPRLQPRPLSPDRSVTSMLAQSRLLLSGVCHGGEAKAASPDGRHHQSQLWWVCVIQWCCFWVIPKITGGFRVIAHFTIEVYDSSNPAKFEKWIDTIDQATHITGRDLRKELLKKSDGVIRNTLLMMDNGWSDDAIITKLHQDFSSLSTMNRAREELKNLY